jgi:mRNA interferase RelE/StbE
LFEVNAKKSVLKVISKLDSKRKEKLKDMVATLKDNPVPVRIYDVAKLKGYDSIYRIRIGSLRLVYEISWSDKKITIHKVEERESVYENI